MSEAENNTTLYQSVSHDTLLMRCTDVYYSKEMKCHTQQEECKHWRINAKYRFAFAESTRRH